jgi:cob(I)alamin adenosyltransferase
VCAAHLHVARTVTRRAERLTTKLSERNAKLDKINPLAVIFLNRLSDLLFVLSRKVNDNGLTDVLWEPGKNR